MNTGDLNHLLDRMIEAEVLDIVGGALSPPTEAVKEEVAQLVPRNPMPENLKTLLARAHGAYLGGWSVSLFTLDELEDVNNRQDSLFTYVPSAIFFASDGGDGFFFVDTANRLGRGDEAVFWVYRGGVVPPRCVPCGRNLVAFLTSFLRGEKVWKGPSLEELAIDRMLEALDTYQDRWTGGTGAKLGDIIRVADRNSLRLPQVLQKLLRRSDGIVFPRTGVTVWGTEAIQRLDLTFSGGYRPRAYLMGQDSRGNPLAITLDDDPARVPSGWPYLEGWLVPLISGRPAQEAQTWGYLPELVLAWLEAS
jgi:hypothetical protein